MQSVIQNNNAFLIIHLRQVNNPRYSVQDARYVYWQKVSLMHLHCSVFDWINPVVRHCAAAENCFAQWCATDRAIKSSCVRISVDP